MHLEEKQTGESIRRVLNRIIDLLHKLSNKKIDLQQTKKELSILLSNYFLSQPGDENALTEDNKVKLEFFLHQARGILEKVDAGTTPLYEAIMLMNKIVMQSAVEEENTSDWGISKKEHTETEQPIENEPQTLPLQEQKIERLASQNDIQGLLDKVVSCKKELAESINRLNVMLKDVGLALTELDK